ncbi:hypothetical protein IFR05_009891 [Cadophora sp. M221]|nr:hypothetical protein IFR05_009891 [Cadophora sp. M221]
MLGNSEIDKVIPGSGDVLDRGPDIVNVTLPNTCVVSDTESSKDVCSWVGVAELPPGIVCDFEASEFIKVRVQRDCGVLDGIIVPSSRVEVAVEYESRVEDSEAVGAKIDLESVLERLKTDIDVSETETEVTGLDNCPDVEPPVDTGCCEMLGAAPEIGELDVKTPRLEVISNEPDDREILRDSVGIPLIDSEVKNCAAGLVIFDGFGVDVESLEVNCAVTNELVTNDPETKIEVSLPKEACGTGAWVVVDEPGMENDIDVAEALSPNSVLETPRVKLVEDKDPVEPGALLESTVAERVEPEVDVAAPDVSCVPRNVEVAPSVNSLPDAVSMLLDCVSEVVRDSDNIEDWSKIELGSPDKDIDLRTELND